MTARGHELLQAELKKLKSEDRPEVIKAIAEARAHGDLKENAISRKMPSTTLQKISKASSKHVSRTSKASCRTCRSLTSQLSMRAAKLSLVPR
jgi:transcription elongation GreA/GreB family factor